MSWSARRRPDGEFILTNLSKTDTAHHVALSAAGLQVGDWEAPPSWPEVAPKQTVDFQARRDPLSPLEPRLTVVWEDADGLAHEAYPQIRGL